MPEPSGNESRDVYLDGMEKVSVLMISLGTELAAEVFRYLSQEEIERVSRGILRWKQVPNHVRSAVLQEFREIRLARQYIAEGGLEYAQRLLERALGPQRAGSLIRRLMASVQAPPFESLRNSDPSQLFQFIQNEHPQTIALVLAHLPADVAAVVLSGLAPEVQAEVALRIVTMSRTAPEVIAEVEQVIQSRLSTMVDRVTTSVGGPQALVEILNRGDRSMERVILSALSESQPDMADELKQLMFIFEDIQKLDNRAIQLILREVDSDDLRLALKGTSESFREVVFRNMSERAAQSLREDLELMGPVRVRDVEQAQQRIVAVVRQLEEAGEVVIGRGAEDNLIE